MLTEIRLSSFLLRVGLGIVFMYAAVSSLLVPESWFAFVPRFITVILPVGIFLFAWAIYQILLALWLWSGFRVRLSAVFAVATMFSIIVFNLSVLDILFRDLAILSAALALFVLSGEKITYAIYYNVYCFINRRDHDCLVSCF